MDHGDIGVIGCFAFGETLLNGQTIRTKIMTEELIAKYGKDHIICVDTYNYRKRALRVAVSSLRCFIQCKKIILILSRNGCNFYYPLASFVSKHFNRKIFNNLIGGGNVELYLENKKHIEYCSDFVVNWAQGKEQVKNLKDIGLLNTKELPNMKLLQIVSEDSIQSGFTESKYRFCTFSRIHEQKGIENAINAISDIKQQIPELNIGLDIYGQIDPEYEKRFKEIMSNSPDYIRYCGYIDYDKTSQALEKYYMLLFPTTFYGEGFPGTILDAYAAGLPVIATDWHSNAEVVKDGITGYIYDPNSPDDLRKLVLKAIKDPGSVLKMKLNSIKEALLYTPDKIMPRIYRELEQI